MKWHIHFVLLTAIMVGLFSVKQVNAQGNLLVNGGFDVQGFPYPNDFNLILGPWVWGGSIGYTWANDEGETVGPGVTLDSGGAVGFGDGYISQDITTVPGQTYRVTIVAHARGTTSGTWLQPLWGGTTLPLGFAAYFEWTAISYQVEAAGDNTRFTLMPALNNQGPTWIDSVSVMAIPEPNAVTLFAIGIGLVFFGASQRSAK